LSKRRAVSVKKIGTQRKEKRESTEKGGNPVELRLTGECIGGNGFRGKEEKFVWKRKGGDQFLWESKVKRRITDSDVLSSRSLVFRGGKVGV